MHTVVAHWPELLWWVSEGSGWEADGNEKFGGTAYLAEGWGEEAEKIEGVYKVKAEIYMRV